jgi:hypothetical protein
MNGVDDSSPVALAARPPSTHYSSSAGAPKLVLPATDGGMSRRELLHSLIGGKTDLQTAQFRVQRSFAEPPVHRLQAEVGSFRLDHQNTNVAFAHVMNRLPKTF